MDKKVEILLGSEKNINSVNTDSYTRIELTNESSELTEFNINDVVDSTEVFDQERQDNPNYRLYGRIEWMSLLNGVKNGSKILEDYFNPQYTGDSKNLKDSFDFYVVAPHPSDAYTTVGGDPTKRARSFIVVGGKDDIEIYDAGFTNNVYGEQVFAFSFKSDYDVSGLYDYFGFPVTELFLYIQYKKLPTEEMSRTTWDGSGNPDNDNIFTTKDLVVGDDVENHSGSNIVDVIEYIEDEYFQQQIDQQVFYIRTPYAPGTQWLEWSYNPFIPFQLRYLSDELSTAKASQVIANTSSLKVYTGTNPASGLNATKTEALALSPTNTSFSNWDSYSTGLVNWTPSTGEVDITIPALFTYNIEFKTQIYLPFNSDKYIAQTYLQEDVGSGWVTIAGTTRKYYSNDDPIQSVSISRTYSYGNRIRPRVQLIPNPGERKMEIIPDYAIILTTNKKLVWREINSQGYVEPLTGVGVDYPFFNKRRYLFKPIVFPVIPNLSEVDALKHPNTLNVFAEISFSDNATSLDITPTAEDLNNVDKPCQ